jgi:Flp pilus assembly protein TadG
MNSGLGRLFAKLPLKAAVPFHPETSSMRLINRFKNTTANFVEDQSGNFALAFAAASIALMASVGIAVDYTRLVSAKSQLSSALDSAILSTAQDISRGKIKVKDAKGRMMNFLISNLDERRYPEAKVGLENVTVDSATGGLSAEATVDITMAFPFLGNSPVNTVRVKSGAAYSERKVEVAMVLDVTGSMGDQVVKTGSSKIKDLKAATNVAISAFLDNGNDNTRVAIVPYSTGVNSGSISSAVVDPRGNVPIDKCATERRGVHMFDDASPSVAKVTRADELYIANKDYVCPVAAVQPLTRDKSVLTSLVGKLSPRGYTAGHIGIQWGQYLLSPNWKSLMTAQSAPAAYAEPMTDKYLIVMTDGLFNTDFSKAATLPVKAGIKQASGRLAMGYCDAAKSNGIKIFTIGFDLDGIKDPKERAEAELTLKSCADSEANFYRADSGKELEDAFKDIVVQVQKLRLTT